MAELGKWDRLYDHEKRLVSMRDAAPALYEALDALDTFCRTGEGNADELMAKAGAALSLATGGRENG